MTTNRSTKAKKKPKNEIEVHLHDVRLSFPNIWKPQRFKDGEPKYNASFLIPKDTKQGKRNIELMKAAIEKAKFKRWGDNAPKLKQDKLCLRDGDNEVWDGYAGHMYVSASNRKRPLMFDRQVEELEEDDGLLYAGCYVDAVVRVWAMDNNYGRRVNASLEIIRYVAKGDAFGAAPPDIDDLRDLPDEDDEDEDDDFEPRRRSRDDDDDDYDDDDEPAPKRKAKRSRDDDDDDEF